MSRVRVLFLLGSTIFLSFSALFLFIRLRHADFSGGASVSVRLEEALSGRPLVGVAVLGGGGSVETDESGCAHFQGIPAGSVTFRVAFAGFRDFFQAYELKRGNNADVTFSLEIPTGEVSGRVVDADGGYVEGARVAAGGDVGETAADGRFVLSDVAVGAPTVFITKEGFEDLKLEIELNRGMVKDVGKLGLK
jgi:hypothetical protein